MVVLNRYIKIQKPSNLVLIHVSPYPFTTNQLSLIFLVIGGLVEISTPDALPDTTLYLSGLGTGTGEPTMDEAHHAPWELNPDFLCTSPARNQLTYPVAKIGIVIYFSAILKSIFLNPKQQFR